MMRNGKQVVVLYLEDWQQRMIKDFLGVDCDQWEVPIEKGPVFLYGVFLHPPSEYKRMYLTEWQMREVRDEAGTTCDFIELKKEINMKYGVKTK
jgi:hypothetical protein